MRRFGCNHVGFGLFVFLGFFGGFSQFGVKHSRGKSCLEKAMSRQSLNVFQLVYGIAESL